MSHSYFDVTRWLLKQETCKPRGKGDGYQETALHIAAQMGNMKMIRLLLENHPDIINMRDPKGQTALHLATWFGHLNTAHLLLEKGASTDIHAHKKGYPFSYLNFFEKSYLFGRLRIYKLGRRFLREKNIKFKRI